MKKYFTLIEIALALGVSFLAVTILIAFLPTSFHRIQNSQARFYAANAAQEFSVFLKNKVTNDPVPYRYKTSPTEWNDDYLDHLQKWDDNLKTTSDSTKSNSMPLVKYSGDDISFNASAYTVPTGFQGTRITQHDDAPLYLFD